MSLSLPSLTAHSNSIRMMNDRPSLLVLARFPHTQNAPAPRISRRGDRRAVRLLHVHGRLFVLDDRHVVVVVVHDVLAVLVLAAGPQAQDAAAALARTGACSAGGAGIRAFLVDAGRVEAVPDAGAAALAVGPAVFLVGRLAPVVLFVFGWVGVGGAVGRGGFGGVVGVVATESVDIERDVGGLWMRHRGWPLRVDLLWFIWYSMVS